MGRVNRVARRKAGRHCPFGKGDHFGQIFRAGMARRAQGKAGCVAVTHGLRRGVAPDLG